MTSSSTGSLHVDFSISMLIVRIFLNGEQSTCPGCLEDAVADWLHVNGIFITNGYTLKSSKVVQDKYGTFIDGGTSAMNL